MVAAYKATGTLTGALTTADVTPPNPTHAANDILICVTANRVITNTCATPAGWTLLQGPVDETAWRSYVFWIRAAAAGTTNPLCNWTATSADKYAQVHCVQGAIRTGDPFAAQSWTDGPADPAVATGVTTTAANQYVCLLGMSADNVGAITTYIATNPATFTERHESTTTIGADAGGFFADAYRVSPGATGNVSVDGPTWTPLHWGILVAAILDEPTPFAMTVPNRATQVRERVGFWR